MMMTAASVPFSHAVLFLLAVLQLNLLGDGADAQTPMQPSCAQSVLQRITSRTSGGPIAHVICCNGARMTGSSPSGCCSPPALINLPFLPFIRSIRSGVHGQFTRAAPAPVPLNRCV
eukprot:1143460-Pelagomonas_calceolata.AAC.4